MIDRYRKVFEEVIQLGINFLYCIPPSGGFFENNIEMKNYATRKLKELCAELKIQIDEMDAVLPALNVYRDTQYHFSWTIDKDATAPAIWSAYDVIMAYWQIFMCAPTDVFHCFATCPYRGLSPYGPDGLNHKALGKPPAEVIVPVRQHFVPNEVQEFETTPLQFAELIDSNIILIPLDTLDLIMKESGKGDMYIAWAPKGVLMVLNNLCGIGTRSSFAKVKALQRRAHITMCYVRREFAHIYQESLVKWPNRGRLQESQGSFAGACGSGKPVMLAARVIIRREVLPNKEDSRSHSFMSDLNECSQEDLQALRDTCNIPGFEYEVEDFTVKFANATLRAHNDVEAHMAAGKSDLDYKKESPPQSSSVQAGDHHSPVYQSWARQRTQHRVYEEAPSHAYQRIQQVLAWRQHSWGVCRLSKLHGQPSMPSRT